MLDHKDTYLNEELLKSFYDKIGDQNKYFYFLINFNKEFFYYHKEKF